MLSLLRLEATVHDDVIAEQISDRALVLRFGNSSRGDGLDSAGGCSGFR